jgi:hypothetical protein
VLGAKGIIDGAPTDDHDLGRLVHQKRVTSVDHNPGEGDTHCRVDAI